MTRHFKSFKAAADETAESTIFTGDHFRTSNEKGIKQGTEVAKYVMKNAMQP